MKQRERRKRIRISRFAFLSITAVIVTEIFTVMIRTLVLIFCFSYQVKKVFGDFGVFW